jgi:hypothetical protein
MRGWAPDVIGAIGNPESRPEEYLDVFFAPSSSSRQAGQQAPQALVKIYPDLAHGFLFQHHAEFAADVEAFLTGPS